MWRFLRKRRALKAYRTTLFHHLRDTYGRKLYYSTEEVQTSIRDIGASLVWQCYALGMFTERAVFDAYHAATGEVCDYTAMRAEIFAHVADVAANAASMAAFDGGCGPLHDALDGGHHDAGHHDAAHHSGGDHGGGDFGGGHHGGGDHGGSDFGGGHHGGGGDFGGGDFGGGSHH